mmetsp:Transcript_5460/g.16900  ORF Transcript_5460/g.16900 Transcript_5460/m.16900 type:complete len:251 (+) Transcript_5460:857-1609(+)
MCAQEASRMSRLDRSVRSGRQIAAGHPCRAASLAVGGRICCGNRATLRSSSGDRPSSNTCMTYGDSAPFASGAARAHPVASSQRMLPPGRAASGACVEWTWHTSSSVICSLRRMGRKACAMASGSYTPFSSREGEKYTNLRSALQLRFVSIFCLFKAPMSSAVPQASNGETSAARRQMKGIEAATRRFASASPLGPSSSGRLTPPPPKPSARNGAKRAGGLVAAHGLPIFGIPAMMPLCTAAMPPASTVT